MLADYEQYVMADGGLAADSSAMCGPTTTNCSSSLGEQQHVDAGGYLVGPGWAAADDAYTLTVLSDAGQPATPPSSFPDTMTMTANWGVEPWQQHGPAHAGNPFEEEAVTASDGSSAGSPERRCVRSLLHVALQKGGSFAQQFTSCGVPPGCYPSFMPDPEPSLPPCYPTPLPGAEPTSCYLEAVKQEPVPLASPGMFVSSTSSCSPRPVTPADSLRSCYSPASPYVLPPLQPPPPPPHDDAVVSTTCFALPPPSYSAFRPPYPTPSPDPAPLLPLSVQLMAGMSAATATPPTTPTSRAAKRRRSRAAAAQGGNAPIRKRERSERQLHPCSLCDKRFKDNYSVNVHMRTHTGEKPFPCMVCGKMFRQKAHLAKHRSTHQPAEWAAAAEQHSDLGVDGNSNSLPLWAETKCKAANVWTPMPPTMSSVQ